MTLPSNSVDPQEIAPDMQPMLWSIRRELWESRWIYLAPLAIAAFVLFATSFANIGLPRKIRNSPTLDPAKRHLTIVQPYSMAPAPIMLVGFLIGAFYAIDALYGERRDRSILFWKSLPVSDTTTVLSKAAIPLIVLPLIAFVLSVATQLTMLAMSTMVLLANGMSPLPLWAEFHYPQEPVVMIYGLIVHALWFSPMYAWLLLVSARAKRAPILWAALPPLVPMAFERIAFHTTYFGNMLKYRIVGAMGAAFAPGQQRGVIDRFGQLTPFNFLTTPGLWVGLFFTAVFLAAAIKLRHNREPI